MNSNLPTAAAQTSANTTNGRDRSAYYVTPSATVRENKDGYVVEADLPGVSKEGLDLTVQNGELVIVGRRTATQANGQTLYRESRRHDFRRAFELDASIDSTGITANLDQGVLTLHLPKAEALKPRKITVG